MSTGTDLSDQTQHRKPLATAARWRPGRNVLALSAVSFLTDASSEIIAPLLPLFLTGTLGASVAFVGLIEGAAESVASLLKLGSGWWSDRLKRRKPLIVAGYAIASFARPLVGLAGSAGQVLAIRLADRVGKGMRGAPRDALLAASTDAATRGRAFGFHRAADHAGAVVGPLIAMLCLGAFAMPIRQVFLVAAIPGALAVLVAVVWVREQSDHVVAPSRTPMAPSPDAHAAHVSVEPLGVPFRNAMLAIVLFTLGNSTDAFLLLRANQLGVPIAVIPLLWILLHVVKMLSSTPGGSLSDRLGRRPLIAGGWMLYAIVYLGFAFATAPWHAWALFGIYGVVFGLTEGAEKALVADLVPVLRRGTAFGWYHAAVGVAALPASLLFGVLWDRYGAPVAFASGSAIAILAALAFLTVSSSASPDGYTDR
ncbi:MAG: MFS transporter [Gemmatimonadota bacterium]